MQQLSEFFGQNLSMQASNFYLRHAQTDAVNQQQTNDTFSDKWDSLKSSVNMAQAENFQKGWFQELYGFADEDALRAFLSDKSVILDAGCGIGYKSA